MKIKEKNFISVVVYVHNAEKRIESFLKMIIRTLEENFEHSEIICVNDYCDDNSVEIIKKVNKIVASTNITILSMSYFHGLETAMTAGNDLAIGDFVLEFDSTLQDFAPEEIMKIYHKMLEGFDIVSASPDKKQRLSSRIFYHVFDQFSSINYKINTERFRILSRRAINRINSINKSIPYRKAVYANCGLKNINIHYTPPQVPPHLSLDHKETKYRRGLAIDTLILFTNVGYSFAATMTVLMILTTVFMATYSIIIYVSSSPVAGWTTTILFLSVAFFGLFAILTIIIKYLQILLNLIFKAKQYNFEEIEKLSNEGMNKK